MRNEEVETMQTLEKDHDARIERFKRQVEEEWQNPEIYASYRKWDREEAEWGRAARDLIVERAALTDGLAVLDVASGHGEPALAIAEGVGPSGHVTATDLGPGLLELAGEKAAALGLSNLTFRVADAHELPFPDGTFDRVTCRLGAMYFADHAQAFAEALRVLKPGGHAVYLVWAGFDQPLFRDVVGPLLERVQPPEDEPGAPSPFTFAQPGTITAALAGAGFADVREEQLTIPSTFPGTPEAWWNWFVDMAPPFQTLIASLSDADRDGVTTHIHEVLRTHYRDGIVDMPIDVIVATGLRAP